MSPGLTPPARTARHRAPLGATLRLRSRVTMVTGMGPGDPRSHRHRDSVHPGPRAMPITAAGMALDTAGTAVQDTRRSATPVTRPAPTAPPWPHQPRLGAAVSEGTWARLDTLLDPPWPGWVAELLGRGPEMGVHVFSSPHSPQERGPRTEGRADRGARGRGGQRWPERQHLGQSVALLAEAAGPLTGGAPEVWASSPHQGPGPTSGMEPLGVITAPCCLLPTAPPAPAQPGCAASGRSWEPVGPGSSHALAAVPQAALAHPPPPPVLLRVWQERGRQGWGGCDGGNRAETLSQTPWG